MQAHRVTALLVLRIGHIGSRKNSGRKEMALCGVFHGFSRISIVHTVLLYLVAFSPGTCILYVPDMTSSYPGPPRPWSLRHNSPVLLSAFLSTDIRKDCECVCVCVCLAVTWQRRKSTD